MKYSWCYALALRYCEGSATIESNNTFRFLVNYFATDNNPRN